MEQQYKKLTTTADTLQQEYTAKTADSATADAKQEAEIIIKPKIINVNKQIIKLMQLMKDQLNNPSLSPQQDDEIKRQTKELDTLMKTLASLEQKIIIRKATQSTRAAQINQTYTDARRKWYFYIAMTLINSLLIITLIICLYRQSV